MKKLCLLTFALLLTLVSTWGQAVLNYNFKVTQEGYTPLSHDASDIDLSSVTYLAETVFAPENPILTLSDIDVEGFDLGFTVNYNGVDCDHFVIYGFGAIQLGGKSIHLLPDVNASPIVNGLVNGLVCYNKDGTALFNDDTKILYQVSGEAPNRVLTVEFRQIGLTQAWGASALHGITYQISIKEDGTISYCFEEFDAGEEYYNFYIGLTGNKDEYMTLGGSGVSLDDDNSYSTNANYSVINKIAAGKTVTLTPPADCSTPTEQPTNLMISTTSNQIDGSFDESDADHYLIVYTDGSDLTDIPADGTYYAAGDVIGNAKVVDYSKDTSFCLKNQPASTSYKFYVFAANSLCSKGPSYLNKSPLSLAVRTKIVTPVLSVSDITHNSAKLSWTGSQYNSEIKFGKVGEEPTIFEATGSELLMTDLDFSSNYTASIRAVDGKGDYSEWSKSVDFTTANYPDCVAPTNLEANIDNFSEDKSAVLTWVASDDHLTWEVRYRKSIDSDYTYVSNLTEPTTTLTELDEETAYLWNVRAACTYDRTTVWSTQSNFDTPLCSGLSTLAAKQLSVRGKNGYLNIINGPAAVIEFVEVYDVAGNLVKRVEVGATDNVMIPIGKTHGVYIVTVGLAKKTATYKIEL